MPYEPDPKRYEKIDYKRCGHSGLRLSRLSLGLWHNFGGIDEFSKARELILHAFDAGVTHFDLANNYGPPGGSAEATFGKICGSDLAFYRDELIISTKAGHSMWPGPYGDWGSRKHLLGSLDQSLSRMGLDYVDIFYSHRPDPETPMEETMSALAHTVQTGKALYVGISNYSPEQTAEASSLLKELGTPCLVHQPPYNMFDRGIEGGLTEVLEREGIGCIPFSPLSQGMLTNRYLEGIPADSRAGKDQGVLQKEAVRDFLPKIQSLNELAVQRGQTLANLALSWILRLPQVTSVLVGASSTKQIDENLEALEQPPFTEETLDLIDEILKR